jgi:hypothetical protein
MVFTKKELGVLKILVDKELEHVKKDAEAMVISNAPFIGKELLDDNDFEFLKAETMYLGFLKDLSGKLVEKKKVLKKVEHVQKESNVNEDKVIDQEVKQEIKEEIKEEVSEAVDVVNEN